MEQVLERQKIGIPDSLTTSTSPILQEKIEIQKPRIQEIQELFQWFSTNDEFLHDVRDIITAHEHSFDSLLTLKKHYQSRLLTSQYKKHFSSLLFLIEEIQNSTHSRALIREIYSKTSETRKKMVALKQNIIINQKEELQERKKSISSIKNEGTKIGLSHDPSKNISISWNKKENISTDPRNQEIIQELSRILQEKFGK